MIPDLTYNVVSCHVAMSYIGDQRRFKKIAKDRGRTLERGVRK